MTEEIIPGSKDFPSRHDGFLKAETGELIFTLLERDICTPATIHHWCDLRRKWARENFSGDDLKAELTQIMEAEELAFAIEDRQKNHPVQVEPKRKSYSGVVVEDDNAWREQMARGVGLLHNAVADIAEARDIFAALSLLDKDDKVSLDSAMNIARDIAVERSPKHASFAERPTLEMLKAGQ